MLSQRMLMVVNTIPYLNTSAIAWYDMSDANSINATGNDTNQLNDKSGNGFHLTSSSTNRPQTGTQTINGLNVLDFDGSNDRMTNSSLNSYIQAGDNFTIYAVFKTDQTAARAHLISSDTGTNDRTVISFNISGELASGLYTGTYNLVANTLSDTSNPHLVVFTNAAGTVNHLLDSIEDNASSSTTFVNQNNIFVLGGRTDANPYYWDGQIAEVFIDGAVHDADTIAINSAILAEKWGVNIYIPTRSIDFEASSSQFLSIAGSTFGALSDTKFTYVVRGKRESTGAIMVMMWKKPTSSATVFLRYNVGNRVEVQVINSSGTLIGNLITGDVYTDTTNFHTWQVDWDSDNPTEADRIRLYRDGVRLGSFNTELQPSQGAAIGDTADGSVYHGSTGAAWYYDGLLYQQAYFNNNNPDAATLHNGGTPISYNNIPGLMSHLYTTESGNIGYDSALAANWTNTNTAIKSTDIPT